MWLISHFVLVLLIMQQLNSFDRCKCHVLNFANLLNIYHVHLGLF